MSHGSTTKMVCDAYVHHKKLVFRGVTSMRGLIPTVLRILCAAMSRDTKGGENYKAFMDPTLASFVSRLMTAYSILSTEDMSPTRGSEWPPTHRWD